MAPIPNVLSSPASITAAVATGDQKPPNGSWRTGPAIAGVDLVAMLVSDSGLANTEPTWWNASPFGCFLIGLQPRGGWQVMQRAVQWGQDHLAHAFGVNCTKPALFAYFACGMRNRIEVWDSPRWTSPMQGEKSSNKWNVVGEAKVSRPTKLIDGSRGGQAFVAQLLRPKDEEHYSIEAQARAQFLSVILVAAGLMNTPSSESLKKMLREDFQVGDNLGSVFKWLFRYLFVANLIVVAIFVTVAVALWNDNIYRGFTPYIVELMSIGSWAVGAIGLVMLGGNPRVHIVEKELPAHIEQRLQFLSEQHPEGNAKIDFGSLHGSVFVHDKGHCFISLDIVRMVCGWDLVLKRTRWWYAGMLWCSTLLITSIVLQIAGAKTATTGSAAVGIVVLICTSILRGSGISGPEEWQIPAWKRRRNTNYGAALQGSMSSR